MITTLNAIRQHRPCSDGWRKLLSHLGKSAADDEPLSIITILDSNGLDDALWRLRAVDGHDREMRLYAVWCARQVQHLIADESSLRALEGAEAHAYGRATDAELCAAREAVEEAAGIAAWAARAAAWAAARVAAREVAGAAGAAGAAASDAARAAQATRLREICSAQRSRT